MAERSERGSSLPLIIAFFTVVLVLVVVVIDASVAYLRRQELDALADGAALQGADLGAQGDAVYRGGLGEGSLEVSPAQARRAVEEYLRDVGAHAQHPGLVASVRVEGDRVLVTVSAPVDLPLHVPGVPLRPAVTSTASAEVHLDLVVPGP
ncbi:pilus assembly protein TadG-related protein [Nocardioides sp. GY 10113]|uniref:pilus assembly protein TadG-related protein n=1 Tax=Nocardioides sp. GY 10113 TaxID=2569761 RepID=UPI001F106D71|nr:pilus assembly protein TadG-related protein [Nocardioides sp. GY 10113]